jgi:hypothetical protein
MKKTFIFREILMILCISLILSLQSTGAFAYSGAGGPDGPHRGPENITMGHGHYRYHDSRFYRPIFFGLFEILVDIPPVGAVVTVLPIGHKVIVTEGVQYYYYDNVYYTAVPGGYIVVPAPAVKSNITVVPSVTIQSQKVSGETVVINIPNSGGSYTPVALVKQKDGYTGPQGEYYPGHPTIDQLKVLYGK